MVKTAAVFSLLFTSVSPFHACFLHLPCHKYLGVTYVNTRSDYEKNIEFSGRIFKKIYNVIDYFVHLFILFKMVSQHSDLFLLWGIL